MGYSFLFLAISVVLLPHLSANDSFKENLVIKNLNDAVSFHFNFQTTTSNLISNNYHLFPKSISEIVNRYSISEMHLSLARGFWDVDKWGTPPVSLPPSSAELWTWFEPTEREIDEKWEHLSHALSGLFCTSLNKLATKREVITPQWSYNPEGLTNRDRNNTLVRKSVLSGESVCTENLTPWIKLLPCKKLAGLAQLLKPSRLFSTHFTSIAMSVKKVCMTKECNTIGRLIHQTITLVLDRQIFGNYRNVWSLESLLNMENKIEFCALSETSRIYVHGFGPVINLDIPPSGFIESGQIAYYDLDKFIEKGSNMINIKIGGSWPVDRSINNLSETCPIHFTKFATGYGKIRGGIEATIKSKSAKTIRVVYLDSIPWYFQFLFSSVKIKANSKVLKPRKIFYSPSITRERMTHLELMIDIPAHSTVTISYEFRKILLNWNEFPPDANHEFYISPSTLTFNFPGAQKGFNNSLLDVIETANIVPSYIDKQYKIIRLHSEVVLVTLPCPDFSMPFNALCLACTVIAIMIGGVHKYTTSSIYVVDVKNDGFKGKLLRLVLFLRSRYLKKNLETVVETERREETVQESDTGDMR